jgi:hypothetical protein
MSDLFILFYSGGGGVKFMIHFEGGGQGLKFWEPLHFKFSFPTACSWHSFCRENLLYCRLNMNQLWNDIVTETPNNSDEKKLSQYHSVHHRSHWFHLGTNPVCRGEKRRLIACALARPPCLKLTINWTSVQHSIANCCSDVAPWTHEQESLHVYYFMQRGSTGGPWATSGRRPLVIKTAKLLVNLLPVSTR